MTEYTFAFASEAETEAFGRMLALFARPGQAILLSGELGSGKSVLARALIRALAPDMPDLDVPSPTFTLTQTYTETRIPVAHADLYRIAGESETLELGLDELARDHLLVVEWPERIGAAPANDMLHISLSGSGKTRTATVRAEGAWAAALARNAEIEIFLEASGWGKAERRRYETLTRGEQWTILMDMPARPDGPPVKNGLPYSAVAHLAEDIGAVLAVSRHLKATGYSAPETFAADRRRGLAIIEDLGRDVFGQMMAEGRDMREPQRAAIELLADMAGRGWPETAEIPGDGTHRLARYDRDAQMIEVELLADWFWPLRKNGTMPERVRQDFAAAWLSLLPIADPVNAVWTLRDFHSPNLIWLAERSGLARVGLIDTQDCVLGHPAYDLVSFLQDARVDVPETVEAELFAHYCTCRNAQGGFERAGFEAAYAVLGAQRATKILGIFARLSRRDGKHGYLRHIPRVSSYLERNLRHEALSGLRSWFARHLPQKDREAQ
jgi:hypothetical protein